MITNTEYSYLPYWHGELYLAIKKIFNDNRWPQYHTLRRLVREAGLGDWPGMEGLCNHLHVSLYFEREQASREQTAADKLRRQQEQKQLFREQQQRLRERAEQLKARRANA